MNALRFLIRLVEPLLAGQAQTNEQNSRISLPFIPGSMVRGALIRRYIAGSTLDAADDIAQQLFLNGEVCYLNAYPAHPANNSRMLPKPLSWFVRKEDAVNSLAPIHDFAVKREAWDRPEKPPGLGKFFWCDTEAVDGDDGSLSPLTQSVELYSPKIRVTVHNASKDRNQKKEGDSQVFRYDAIAPGEVFAGVVISDNETILRDSVRPLLEKGEMLLGGARASGYGRVLFTNISFEPQWREFVPVKSADSVRSEAKLVCLSDVILRDANGHAGSCLAELAGAKPVQGKIFQRMRLVGGFNRKWGLPLPQAWAIQAGSVIVFPAECKDRLERLAETGIGERRAEGFGRVGVNLDGSPKLLQRGIPNRIPEEEPTTSLSEEEREVAQQMAMRQLEVLLEYKLTTAITSIGSKFSKLPSATQLSRARLVARNAWLKQDLKIITQHFQKLSRSTLREWQEAKIGNLDFPKWIDFQIGGKSPFETVFEIPTVGGVPAEYSNLRVRTIARFIEGVLKSAAKKAKEAEGGLP